MDQPTDRRATHALASVGAALGEPSRAAMLVALMQKGELRASALAGAASVAVSTATSHLACLVAANLVTVRTAGRERLYRLGGEGVASAIERVAALGMRPRGSGRPKPHEPLTLLRTCYSHLAGVVAVAFWARAREKRWVRWSEPAVALLPRGRDALEELGLLPAAPATTSEEPRLRGALCLDWTERVPHVSGPLGIAVCKGFFDAGWIAREGRSRVLRITTRGEQRLAGLGLPRSAP